MRAFIVRPFGVKNDIDFDQVERELIDPALTAVQADGRTTGEILHAGNIRTDMFEKLLTADLVIADLSIHNANVFYELGIRHSLREKRTFMIRSEGDSYPFDLQTDRYFTYDRKNPAKSLPGLITALQQTLASPDQDSPVFRSLPNMKAQDPAKFLAVPTGFHEAVEIAKSNRILGDLELLAFEAGGFDWGVEGLRVVGRAQFDLKAWHGARDTWEAVRRFDLQDLEASTLLGTIYQKLGDLTLSDVAIQRVLKRTDIGGPERAEVLALLARNAKVNWRRSWEELPAGERPAAALRSAHLQAALTSYAEAFREALNHFYSGLNALALHKVLLELAAALPQVWAEPYDDEDAARRALEESKAQFRALAGAVELSIGSAKARQAREGKPDPWARFSEADFLCLTSDKPKRVANVYRTARVGSTIFNVSSARDQLLLYQGLGIMTDNVTAALAELAGPEPPQDAKSRALLFTGHRIDEQGQPPRFPADKEDVARRAIREAVEKEHARAPITYGIAGGASGGDILFHEVCAELGIPTRLYLALPPDKYIVTSVQKAGPQWVDRFDQLVESHPEKRELCEEEKLPDWLVGRPGYDFWQRNSLWLLNNALAEQERSTTVIALWNGEPATRPGGTADLVEQARQRGANVKPLDTKALFGLP
jgi:hypothetical protein